MPETQSFLLLLQAAGTKAQAGLRSFEPQEWVDFGREDPREGVRRWKSGSQSDRRERAGFGETQGNFGRDVWILPERGIAIELLCRRGRRKEKVRCWMVWSSNSEKTPSPKYLASCPSGSLYFETGARKFKPSRVLMPVWPWFPPKCMVWWPPHP